MSTSSRDQADSRCHFKFKLVLDGNSGVGKTSVVTSYVDKGFSEKFIPTLGVETR